MISHKTQPIFILSCERSGSTMLRFIIDTHSKIACPGHLYIGALCESLNKVLLGSVAQNYCELNKEEKKNLACEETRQIVNNIMNRYIEKKGKATWCEKTPMNLEYLTVIHDHFPDAKYICLYRHCMDVVYSSINLSKYKFLSEHVPYILRNGENIVAGMIENWLDKTKKLIEFQNAHGNSCFAIKYEAIVTEPEETLAKMFNFIGFDMEDGLLDKVFAKKHDEGEGDGKALLSSKISRQSVGKGVFVPKSSIPDQFSKEVDKYLNYLGYDELEEYYSSVNSNSLKYHIVNKGSICDIFNKNFKKKINQNNSLTREIDSVCRVVVKGHSNSSWIIDFSNRDCYIDDKLKGVDFEIGLADELLVDLVSGRRNALDAFSSGEIEFRGSNSGDILINIGKILLS